MGFFDRFRKNKNAAAQKASDVAGDAKAVATAAADKADDVLDDIKDSAAAAADKAGELKDKAETAINEGVDQLAEKAGELKDKAEAALDEGVDKFADKADELSDKAQDFAAKGAEKVADKAADLVDDAKAAAAAAAEKAAELKDKAAEAIDKGAEQLANKAADARDNAKVAIAGAAAQAADKVDQLTDAAKAKADEALENAKEAVGEKPDQGEEASAVSLFDLIYGGSDAVIGLTEGAVNDAIAKHGEDKAIAFPDTAYFLPTIYAATGVKVEKLGDLPACVGVMKSLVTHEEELQQGLNAGLATAVGAEIIEALKYVESENPYEGEGGIGFVPDPIIRSLGVPLVTGDIPGVPVVLGATDDVEGLAAIVKDYQSKGLLTFLVGDCIDQLAEAGVKMGLDFRIVPLGHDVTAVTHVVTVAIRAALIFGNLEPGDLAGLLEYTKERVPAFVNTFGEIGAVEVSAGAGAIALGFPVIVDFDLGDMAIAGALESEVDHGATAARSLELRNIKVKAKAVELPVSFAAAFEGEIIRKKDTYVEFDSDHNPTCELVTMVEAADEVEDGKVAIDGPDVPEGAEDIVRLPLATTIKVYGAKMQADFESVIERKIHAWFNYVEGIMHTGQRNLFRIRISKSSFDAGLRLADLGKVLTSMIKDEFGQVVDKVEVTFITDKEKVEAFLNDVAMPRYRQRDDRLSSLTDESVDTFYTCVLCQSFAPAHCCVVTPERLGLCGAVSWLDAKATKELNDAGPSQPIPKTGVIDERLGSYTTVNEVIKDATHGAVESVTLYSLLEDPMTSCGCFECICGVMPETNGVVVCNREYAGMTPTGMTFGELASMTGGGEQTPGFMGHGRNFIASKKFISAEGGPKRIVWMPKELKDDVAARLNKTALEAYGIENFVDMICDETIATDSEGVLNFLTEKGHPALSMDPIM